MTRPVSIPDATAQALAPHPIVSEGCVVAVSGGPDSVALLHAVLDVFRESRSPTPVIVCHMNHGLRGQESDGDEEFVRQLFATLSVQTGNHLRLACTKVSVAALADVQKANVEALARKLRYAWLTEQARHAGSATTVGGRLAGAALVDCP
jgi:tRNA(Ile)-lysidine synthase